MAQFASEREANTRGPSSLLTGQPEGNDRPTAAADRAAAPADQPEEDASTIAYGRAAASPEVPADRRIFGNYEILEMVARGGMGVVYKARDRTLGRLVALKMLRTDVFELSEELVRRFHREAQAIAQLSHPHIVPIYEFGQHNGVYFFAMAFVAGGSLHQHLDRLTGDPRAAAALVEKVARAVHYAHEKGILHRDLKPGNVLLDEQGEPLVSDFGLAKFRHGDVELTRPGQVIGTPAYMAPEQARGQSDRVGEATDVWALGVLLYRLLTGQRPFQGQEDGEVLDRIRQDDPPTPRSIRPGLDRRLETICLKCLEKDPARRYPSAGELADDLARWQRGEPIKARPEGMLAWVTRRLRRHPTLTACLVLLAGFLAVGGFAAWWWDWQRDVKPWPGNLRSLHKELDEGRPVVLVGDKGLPPWYRWQAGKTRLRGADDQPCRLETWSLSLLELLPDVPQERYRFSAEVKASSWKLGEVGIYFAYSQLATKQGPEHWFLALTYAETPYVNGAFLRPHRYREKGAEHGSIHHRGRWGIDHRFASPPRGDGAGWRKIAVEVTPEKVTAFWEGKSIGEARRAELLDTAKELFVKEKGETAPAEFPPQGGLGLYSLTSQADFRRVVVEPLK